MSGKTTFKDRSMADRWDVITLQVENLHLQILPGIGGRLWDVKFHNRSLLFQNSDLIGLSVDETNLTALPTRSLQFKFPLWGGEKTWIAPDYLWAKGAPYTALDSAPFQITSLSATHIELESPVCPISHLSVKRRIDVVSAQRWTIRHHVENHGSAARPTGIWSVMMIDTPAKIGVVANIPKIHSVFGEAGLMVSHNENCLVADCSTQQEFKVGLPNPNGQTLIKFGADGPWLRCAVPKPSQTDRYAHQFPIEIFNSGNYPYCEAEWHSPFSELPTGKTIEFQQNFQIWSKDCPTPHIVNKALYTCMS